MAKGLRASDTSGTPTSPHEGWLKDARRFSTLFETMNQGVVYHNSTGAIIDANPAAERILGLTQDQLLGRTSLDPRWRCVREDFSDLPGSDHPAMISLRTGQPVHDVIMGVYHPLAQQHRWILVSAFPEFDEGKAGPSRVFAVFTDITERKQAELDLKASEERFHTLFTTMEEGFALHEIVCDDSGTPVDYRFLDLNPAFEQLTGLTRSEVLGKRVREVLPDIEARWIQVYGRVAQTGEPAELEDFAGSLGRHYSARCYSPVRGQFAVVFSDITARRQAIEELQRNEEQLRVLFEASQAGIIMVDKTGVIQVANQRMASMFRCSLDELVGSHYSDHVHPDQRRVGGQRLQALIAGQIDHVSNERHYTCKDGSDFWGYVSGRPHEDKDGNLLGLIAHISDITPLKTKEAELVSSERRFRAFFNNLLATSVLYRFLRDQDHVIQDWIMEDINPKGAESLSSDATSLIGKRASELFGPEVFQPYLELSRKVDQTGKAVLFETYFEVNKRHYLSQVFTMDPDFYANVSIDITDRKQAEAQQVRLEQQLRHTQKLESLGVLAGGIAHDFNNILTAVIGSADLALRRVNPESPVVEDLRRIERAAVRAADLAKQMLAYSGKGRFVVETIDLNLLLEEMLHMLEVSISKKAVLRLNKSRPLPPIEVDTTQIRQIVMNLVINASEAIGTNVGAITVTTDSMECDRSYLQEMWLDERLADGLYVTLEVADTGCGMARETVAKVFDPFFTTKFTGRGLGLAAVQGIVRGHKGTIKISSEPGAGSTFKVLLPASKKPAAEVLEASRPKDHWRGSGTALLVDDEATVRMVGSEMLRELGFDVITANDGVDAVQVFKTRREFSFVLLDLMMPRLDGEQTFRELRKIDPKVNVILSSGYDEQDIADRFVGQGLSGFVQKPYRLSTLMDAIKKLQGAS
jgi:PAS domain S-box-containing protein